MPRNRGFRVAVGLIRLAGRIYEFTLLHTGARIGWDEVLRLSRGAAAGN